MASRELERIRATVSELHQRIDRIAIHARDLDVADEGDIVRRAEEAGAALARLEWALDRSIAEELPVPGRI